MGQLGGSKAKNTAGIATTLNTYMNDLSLKNQATNMKIILNG